MSLYSQVNPVMSHPQREKTCLQSVRSSQTQNSLISYRDKLENLNRILAYIYDPIKQMFCSSK